MNAWNTFNGGAWQNEIWRGRDFIQKNGTPYDGDGAFLVPATGRTVKMREKFDALLAEERDKGGVRNVDTGTVITITAFGPGYLDKENEIIVGLQTDEPLKRACNPFGGMRMVREGVQAYGYEVSQNRGGVWYHKTHNDGVFSAWYQRRARARTSACSHRPAGRLRPRPHHRRLPPRRAVRRGPPDRREAEGQGRARRGPDHGNGNPHGRGTVRPDPGAEGHGQDGRVLRF